MKKIAKMVGRVFMEMLTCAFVVCCGCLLMDILYEYTSWTIGQDMESMVGGLFALLGYTVIRYQGQRSIDRYMTTINPKIERVAGMLNQINESSKEDKVA